MKKLLINLLTILTVTLSLSLGSFEATAQRIRTTPTFDADTTTRPKAGFYGIGVRSGRVFLVKPTGTTERILAANTHVGVNGQFLFTNGTVNSWRTPVKGDVGLGNVDNTSDANKPVSTATQTALNGKFNTPTGLTTNILPKWTGSGFTPSLLSDNGTIVSVSGQPFLRRNSTFWNYVYDFDGQISLQLGGTADPVNYYQNTLHVFRTKNGAAEIARFDGSGRLGIGTTSPSASALLDITSTTRGVLLPRMSTAQINAIASPANGLMVYNTTLNKLCVFENGAWRQVTTTAM